MGVCCVDGCDDSHLDLHYFEFPTSRLLRKKWLDVIQVTGKLEIGTLVCSQHFDQEDYENVRGKVRLKRKVVPTMKLRTTNEVPSPIDDKSSSLPELQAKEKLPAQKNIDETQKLKTEASRKKANKAKRKKLRPTEANKEKRKDEGIETDSKKDLEEADSRRRSLDGNEIQNRVNLPPLQELPGIPDPVSNNNKSPTPEDIEDMITNYQIKNKLPNTALATEVVPAEIQDTIEIPGDGSEPPVFIEICVDKDPTTNEAGSQDCLMVLESVQVDVDPSTLMLDPDFDPHEEKETKKDDPISLLTSSDEDDVIIQEPHIDCVEVSDETDEDDMPLVKLVPPPRKPKKSKRKSRKHKNTDFKQILDNMFELYCMECDFTTKDSCEYDKHLAMHGTVLQICPICAYTTSSKIMFTRHLKRHKEEKKFKCPLCSYKARHNMSLIYHMQSHKSRGFKCTICGFKSENKTAILIHSRYCGEKKTEYPCDKCDYKTKRRSDLKRHQSRRHVEINDNCESVLQID